MTQACLLSTFIIVILSTVAYALSKSALRDVARSNGGVDREGVRALELGLSMLTNSLSIVGFLLVCFAAATAYLLAVQLTVPLRELVSKVLFLRPGQRPVRSVHTGDEVEVLDVAFTEMGDRLALTHELQEQELLSRTEDLRRQYKLDRVILDSIHYCVFAVDLQGVVTQANPAAIKMLGDDLVGKTFDAVVQLHEHGMLMTGENPIRACLRTGVSYRSAISAKLSILNQDGANVPIILSVAPLSDHNAIFGALIVLQDITEERHLDYLKSEFISLASHQLRTPLSAIRWYAEMLEDASKNFTDDQRQYVAEINHSVQRMIDLTGALLHAARMEESQTQAELRSVDIASLVSEAVADTQESFASASIFYSMDLPPTPQMVMTDPMLLRVVLQNLLTNAMKYSPKGSSVTIRVEQKGDRVLVHVTDTGIGIPAAEQSRIFEKFFRAQNVRTVDTDGNGLGLYICKSIVDRLGGVMSFESVEKKGTTFTVSLPLQRNA